MPSPLAAAHACHFSHRLCVAPMMDVTDRHHRMLMRLMSRRALLYTEMLTTGALLHGDTAHLLDFDAREQPVALQLGGSEPAAMAACAELAEQYGYVEVNINAGCPSPRVQKGRFGACLMREPALVAECVAAMRAATTLPVTVKCRIGVDEQDEFDDLLRFADAVQAAGSAVLVVHARKAWLNGLSPKQNREIPPLRYDRVYELKARRPEMRIVINGGIGGWDESEQHLREVDGVMLGRAPWHKPYVMADADRRLFAVDAPVPSRDAVALAARDYASTLDARGEPVKRLTRHLVGLFAGEPGGRRWRRAIAELAHLPGADAGVINAALAAREAAAPKQGALA